MTLPALTETPSQTALDGTLASRARLESLLRERKLDRTLTSTLPAVGDAAVASFGIAALDARLGGGVPRGHVSEIVGAVSSGRTTLAVAWLAAATTRGETVALVDAFDRFDPPSAAACGVELSRLLWVRGQAVSKTGGAVDPAWLPGARAVEGPGTMVERTLDRAIKSLNLVLQAGICTAVVFDVADVPLSALRRVPATTWFRLQRIIEGSETACVIVGPTPLARSAAGVTLSTGVSPVWNGAHDRSRRVGGLGITVRISSPRRTATGEVTMQSGTRSEFGASISA